MQKQKQSFEEAMNELEGLVRSLEGGELSLDDSLAAYERAVALVKYCNTALEEAEHRVRILTEGQDGTVTDRPFDGDAT